MNQAELEWLLELRVKLYPEIIKMSPTDYQGRISKLKGVRGLYSNKDSKVEKVGLDGMTDEEIDKLRRDGLVIYFKRIEERLLPRARYTGLAFEKNLGPKIKISSVF